MGCQLVFASLFLFGLLGLLNLKFLCTPKKAVCLALLQQPPPSPCYKMHNESGFNVHKSDKSLFPQRASLPSLLLNTCCCYKISDQNCVRLVVLVVIVQCCTCEKKHPSHTKPSRHDPTPPSERKLKPLKNVSVSSNYRLELVSLALPNLTPMMLAHLNLAK